MRAPSGAAVVMYRELIGQATNRPRTSGSPGLTASRSASARGRTLARPGRLMRKARGVPRAAARRLAALRVLRGTNQGRARPSEAERARPRPSERQTPACKTVLGGVCNDERRSTRVILTRPLCSLALRLAPSLPRASLHFLKPPDRRTPAGSEGLRSVQSIYRYRLRRRELSQSVVGGIVQIHIDGRSRSSFPGADRDTGCGSLPMQPGALGVSL
eukprot:1984959-Prymnesium_polylepis.1